MDNPFIVGAEVEGESFIGRRDQLKQFNDLLYKNDSKSGSISLTGITRIGKSSLIRNAVKLNENKNIITVKTVISKFSDFNEFWTDVLSLVRDELEFVEGNYFKEINALDAAIDAGTNDTYNFRRKVEKAFKLISKQLKLVIVIDEFDFAEYVFGSDSSNFQFFRELISSADYKMTFITISRRSLIHIETRSFGGSTLDGVFKKISLRGFSNEDLQEYFNKFDSLQIKLSDDIKKKILYYGGRSPYLLSAIGQEIVYRQGADDFDSVLSACNQQFLDYFKRIVELLKDEDFYNKLLQIYIGPRYNIKQYDIDELVSRGYISNKIKGFYDTGEDNIDEFKYETISEYFVEYLMDISQPEVGEIWPVLSEAEKKLRSIIEIELTGMFGGRWMEELERVNQEYKKNKRTFIDFDKVNINLAVNKKKYKERASDNILTTVGIMELRNILQHYWTRFAPYFNNDQFSKWSDRFYLLHKARNPLAHNTAEFLTEEEIMETELYCREIISSISKK
jgi:hypothetical protein